MSLQVGIVGLPNVGKSTLFNALALRFGSGHARAAVANFPFTTVDPNVVVVAIPDARLAPLAALAHSARIVPAMLEVVDIAGLVEGAHAGAGLGNQFLARIREVDAIVEVVRFFPDPEVTHVGGRVDPSGDAATIATELALADLQTVERMWDREAPATKGGDSTHRRRLAVLQKFREALSSGKALRHVPLTPEDTETVRDVHLLTRKPVLYVANLDEARIRHADETIRSFAERHAPAVPLSAKLEQELAELPPEERQTFLTEYQLERSGLDALLRAIAELLGLITFYTANENEARAWTVPRGTTALAAAGKVHTDFQRGFIRAETIPWDALVAAGSYAAARERGLVRDEGKAYLVQEGDVLLFKTSTESGATPRA